MNAIQLIKSFKEIVFSPSLSLKQRLLNGAFWSLLGSILGKGFVLVSFILVARILDTYQYGELGMLRSTINLFTVVSGMGIGYTASKYLPQFRNSDKKRAADIYALSNSLSIIIGLIGCIVLIASSNYVAEYSLKASHLATSVQLGAIVLFFTTINGIQSGALAGFEAFKSIAINTFISSIIQSVLLVLMSYYWGIEGCIIALGIGCLSLGVLNRQSIQKKMRAHDIHCDYRSIRKETYQILWRFSLPALLSSLMVVPVIWWAKTLLVAEAGYKEMAIFDVADQWSVMILFIPGTLAQMILPLLSNTLVEGTADQYFKLIKINLLLNFFISIIPALIISALGRFVLSLYGDEFVYPYPLYLMMLVSVLMSICNVIGQVIASRDKMWIGFGFNFLWAIWVIMFSLLLKQYGATGLALSLALSYILHFLAQIIYAFKVVGHGCILNKANY